jgi:BirA family biotin operon repressor/biotin-[acetyl-CoA-carboxylase] ligase
LKGRILKALGEHTGILSGEQLSASLGVSRVTVWKHIRKLQQLGYEIHSSPVGYRLVHCPDALFPWEFEGRESKILYYPQVTSTMNIARNVARKGCPDFTVVVADRQTQGRGRLQRQWLSEEGGLYFTMVLRPQIPVLLSFRVNFMASMILAKLLGTRFGIDARVKWPNDILVDGCKLCGMLAELEAEAERVAFINIGIGINVNNDPCAVQPAATSLKIIKGRRFSRKNLLAAFLDEFEARMKLADFDRVIDDWKKMSMTLGRQVRIVTTREVAEGRAVDVDENGALILEREDGGREKIIYGDCFLV